MIELEVDDLKYDKSWRLLAYENGQLTFSEQKLGEFPLGLVTHPKDARYLHEKEPFYANSTHVRVLAYTSSNAAITQVRVSFNGDTAASQLATPTNVQNLTQNGLYTVAWEPTDFDPSVLNTIRVDIEDSLGRKTSLSHQFSLDGQVAPIGDATSQARQSMGDNTLLFRLPLVVVAIVAALLVFALIVDAENNRDRKVAFMQLFSLLFLLLGPYAIGKFVTVDGPVCFAFSYGIAVPGQGFAIEPQSALYACCIVGFLVLPSLMYCLVRGPSREVEALSLKRFVQSLAGFRMLHHFESENRGCQKKVRSGLRWLLPFYFFLVYPSGIFLNSLWFEGSILYLIISPASIYMLLTLALCCYDFAAVLVDDEDLERKVENSVAPSDSV
jgi:hypothetical protein